MYFTNRSPKTDKLRSFFSKERSISEPQELASSQEIKIREFLSKHPLRTEDRKQLESMIHSKERIVDIIPIMKMDNKPAQRIPRNILTKLPQIHRDSLKEEEAYSPDSLFDSSLRMLSQDNSSDDSEMETQEGILSQREYKLPGIKNAIRQMQSKLIPTESSSFFNFIKKQDRIKDFVQNFKHRDSLNPVFYYCVHDDIFPKRIDLSRYLVNTKEVNFNDLGVTHQYYPILTRLLQSRKCANIKSLHLCQNRLNSWSLSLLIDSFPTQLRELNLSNNELGRKGALLLTTHMTKLPNLKSLNLHNNQLSDAGAITIMNCLIKNQMLTKLNLAENGISDTVLKPLYMLILQNSTLEVLILNWNRLGSGPGLMIAKALNNNRSLRVLDLSYNRLNDDCMAQWCDVVTNPQLAIVHLDISFNQFTQKAMLKFAQAMRLNNTIYGLHVEGNKGAAYVDPYGFIQMQNDKQEVQQHQSKINGVNYIPMQNDVPLSKDCCWICQGWMEHRFVYIPDQNAPQVPIFLHLDFLGYTPIPMTTSAELRNELKLQSKNKNTLELTTGEIVHQLKQITEFENKKITMAAIQEAYAVQKVDEDELLADDLQKFYYTTYQMCPPRRKVLYFFSNPLKEEYFIDPTQLNMATPIDDPILNGNDYSHQEHKFTDGTMLPFNKIEEVNYLVSRQEYIIDDKNNYKVLVKVAPRQSQKKYILHRFSNNLIRKKMNLISWCREESFFRQYPGESEEFIEECFEFDWNCSKIVRFVKSEYERIKLREYMRWIYPKMKDVYKYYSSMGFQSPQFELFCVQFPQYVKIITQMNLIDGELLKLQDVESSLMSIKNNVDQKYLYNPDKALIRYQFMEMFFRISNDKFVRNGICKNYADAAYRILKEFDYYFEHFNNTQQWREERLWNKECDYLLQFKMPFLRKIYNYSVIDNKKWNFKLKWISIREFRDFCRAMNLTELIGEKQVTVIYNFSMMTQVDEVTQDRNVRMSFIEFVESLARLAERISPCPIGDQLEQWTTTARQTLPLHVKLETLLSYLYVKLQQLNSDYEEFADMFASDNPKDAMPQRRKGAKEEDEISNTATLTVYNTLSYLKSYQQPYLNPNWKKFIRASVIDIRKLSYFSKK